MIELVPAPFTDPAAADRAAELFSAAGLVPVRVAKEVEGFVFNRLQGAVLREAYCLVRDGVASVEDVDRVMRDGLGLRWSVIGPFETVDLNTRGGIASHARKMGPPTSGWERSAASTIRGRPNSSRRSRPPAAPCCHSPNGTHGWLGGTAR